MKMINGNYWNDNNSNGGAYGIHGNGFIGVSTH